MRSFLSQFIRTLSFVSSFPCRSFHSFICGIFGLRFSILFLFPPSLSLFTWKRGRQRKTSRIGHSFLHIASARFVSDSAKIIISRRSFEKNLGCIHILLSFAFFSLILLIYLILLLIPVFSSSSLIHSRSRSFAIPCLLPRFIWYISRTDSISRLDCSPQTLQTCLPHMLR